ncbi:MAG: DUF3553 domain-containing protein [Planctomycetota bacterium]
MSLDRIEFGDHVRHPQRPEWGVGQVTRVEEIWVDGDPSQRVAVRFPNAGLKTLSTTHAPLERVNGDGSSVNGHTDDEDNLAAIDADSGLLGDMTKERVREVMTRLPLEIRDPFCTLSRRLRLTFDLYRFDRSGKGLIDWAVAQSGLADPLTRFSRHELEAFFERWIRERDQHLGKLLETAQSEQALVRELLGKAPEPARKAVQRLNAVR